jgi:hypothetical protein
MFVKARCRIVINSLDTSMPAENKDAVGVFWSTFLIRVTCNLWMTDERTSDIPRKPEREERVAARNEKGLRVMKAYLFS